MTANANKTNFNVPRMMTQVYNPALLDSGVTGNVFWVSSLGGTDSTGYGYSPDSPFASIKFACTQAKANNNDLILVLPGHVESVGSTAQSMSVAGVTVRGLGTGRQRGQVTYSNASGYLSLDQAGSCIDNLTFVGTGVASLTKMVNVSAADCTIKNCEFEHANSTNQAADVIITTAAANRLRVDNCNFHGSNTAGTNHAISMVGGDRVFIENCFFSGAYHASQGIILTGTTDATNLIVDHCVIHNYTASNTKALVFTSGTTGYINECHMQILSGTAPITGAAISWAGANYYAAAAGAGSTLI